MRSSTSVHALSAQPERGRTPRAPHELVALALICALAAALRVWSLRAVPTDPFYDAAVRSMGRSLHNLLFGAYEPGGSLAVDKPPVDLWLQVLSTKLFGFGSAQLKYPPVLAGTLAVPILYDAVRRALGALAGLGSALALAVLPIALLTSRSDTMDSVAMVLSVLALWLLVRFGQSGRSRWAYLAAAAMGVAFNVKLFQGLVPLPALALLGVLVCRERRLQRVALATLVFVAVALSWLSLTLLFPASQRPYAIGSTNGSAWNASFIYNGYDRIAGGATNSGLSAAAATAAAKPANNSELARAAVPIGTPGVLRLFDHNGPLSGLRLGFVLLTALLLGVPAMLFALMRARGPDRPLEQAFAASLLAWLATGVVLYSAMARLHPRYTEGFTAAVAAAAGIGLAWALRGGRAQRIAAALAALGLALYGRYLLGDQSALWRVGALAALLAAAANLLADRRRTPALALTLTVAALLLPLRIGTELIANHEYDSGHTGAMGTREVSLIGRYIAARRGGARYEFAAADPSEVGALIVADQQPMLSLTSYGSHELLAIPRLVSLVRSGQLRFGIIDGSCGRSTTVALAACSAGASWIRHHSTDVSRAAGLGRGGVLYRLGTR